MTRGRKWIIAALMCVTIFRAQTVLFLSSTQALGGEVPNAWFGPWLSDAALGFMVPLVVYIFWAGQGPRAWAFLIAYNAVGAFDYVQGLLTQYFHPLPASMASEKSVYFGIGFLLVCQLTALALLFRPAVIDHFVYSENA